MNTESGSDTAGMVTFGILKKKTFVKKLAVSSVALALIIFSSCKKDIHGCTDQAAENFSNAATKDDGSCIYASTDTKSTTVTISNWNQQGNNWVTTLAYSEITSNVMSNGAVVAYIGSGMENVWNMLPLTVYQSTSYSTTIEVSVTVGQVLVYFKNSDDTLPANPGERIFKIAVIE